MLKPDDIVWRGDEKFRVVTILEPPVKGFDVVLQNLQDGFPCIAISRDCKLTEIVYIEKLDTGKYIVAVRPLGVHNKDIWEVDLQEAKKIK